MRLYNCCSIFFAVVLLCAVSHAQDIYNGNFEIAIDFGVPDDKAQLFYPPEGWVRENYAAILDVFVPDYNEGNYGLWKIDTQEGLRPIEGQSFVLLTTGDYVDEPRWASIQQEVFIYTGQTISGYYFFGTLDYHPFPDWGDITLEPADSNSPPRSIILTSVNVDDVGNYSSTEGWEYFEHTFSAEEEGDYYLTIQVHDYKDTLWTSYYAIDGLTLCNSQLDGDINRDCEVNLRDFSWLATDWLENCNDPNYFLEQQSNCFRGTDLNEDGPVDLNDLNIMSNEWLQ